jgi:hypothetical protein
MLDAYCLLLGPITTVHRLLVFYDLECQARHARLHRVVSLGLHIRGVWSHIDPDNADHYRGTCSRHFKFFCVAQRSVGRSKSNGSVLRPSSGDNSADSDHAGCGVRA